VGCCEDSERQGQDILGGETQSRKLLDCFSLISRRVSGTKLLSSCVLTMHCEAEGLVWTQLCGGSLPSVSRSI
jgi:hypothetical protein